MKKNVLCLLLLLSLLFSLSGCNVEYQSADHHFTVKFPESVHVFNPFTVQKDDPALATYGIAYDDLTAFGQEGGVYFGVSQEDNGTRKEITVSVQESTYTQSLWELKKSDTQTVTEFQDELIENFNVSGITVKQKGKFQQGKAYCVYLNIVSGDFENYDTVYMATVYNGKQYSILYSSNQPLTGDDIDQCHGIFDTFYITETLDNPNLETKDQTTTKAVLILVLILIGAAFIALLVFLFTQKRKHREQETEPYTPQFTDSLSTPKKSKEKRK